MENPEEPKMPRTPQELADLMRSTIRAMKEEGTIDQDRTRYLVYYTEANGQNIKLVIDQLMANRKPTLFSYSDYPKLRPKTLYDKINQSIRYLVDKLDTPELYYRNLWENNLELTTKVVDSGLVLRYVEASIGDKPFVVQELSEMAGSNKWKNELDEWLMVSKPGDRWKKDGLGLSDEQVVELKEELSSLVGILYAVDNSKVIVAKKPEEPKEEV